jgi:dTDP-L-rhamnose 4-epimerase
MAKKALVTGGAGFIGSHTVDALVDRDFSVRVLDSMVEQVHGTNVRPTYLPHGVEFIRGDVRTKETMRRALADVDVVFHLAAEVGVGQSMYEIVRYCDVNVVGTANLLEVLANEQHHVEKLIVASSMSIYGEGRYLCPHCGPVYPSLRTEQQLAARQWELTCAHCGASITPRPTNEAKPLQPTSVYAVSKRDQEELCLAVGHAYGIPTVALRFFNTYGTRQALSNPYTGVAAVFASRLLNQHRPIIFEDGLQSRDFVHVSDIVQALMLAMEQDAANYEVFNVGTGRPLTILEVAEKLAAGLGVEIRSQVTSQFRAGDIRHCYADISKIRQTLGYRPGVSFEQGLPELLDWVRTQEATDQGEQAVAELTAHGLTKG